MSRQCPRCQSANTAAIEVAYAREVRTGSLGGATINTSGQLGAFGGTTTSVSAFGRAVAPPSPRDASLMTTLWILLAISAGVFALLTVVLLTDGKANEGAACSLIATVTLAGLGLPFYYSARGANAYNRDVFPALFRRWQNHWVCYQCGGAWEPVPLPPERPPAIPVPSKPAAKPVEPPKRPPGYRGSKSLTYSESPDRADR